MSNTCDAAGTPSPESTIPSGSPLQREMTTPMHDVPVHVGLRTAALPRSMSSWEFLDLEVEGCPAAFSRSSYTETGSLPTCVKVAADHKAGGAYTTLASAATKEVGNDSVEPPFVLLELAGTDNRQTADDAASEHVLSSTSAPSERPHHSSGLTKFVEGHYSLTCSVSTVWSLLSTTSQTPLPATQTGPCPESARTTSTTPNDDDVLATTVTEPTSGDQIGYRKHHDNTVSPLCAGAGVWREDLLPLAPHLIAIPHSYDSATEQTGHGIGATSYTATMLSATNTILIPRIISVATTPLTSDGEQCTGESRMAGASTPTLTDFATLGEHAAVASLASTLPSPSHGAPMLEGGVQRLGEEVTGGEAQAAAVATALECQSGLDGPSIVPPTPCPDAGASALRRRVSQKPAVLLAWLPKPLVSLCDRRRHSCLCQDDAPESSAPRTADIRGTGSVSAQSRQREERKAATWLLRRMSFISSSSFVTSLLPSGMANAPFSSAAVTATSAAAAAPAASSTMFTLEPSLLWSQVCIVCAGGSQRALKGLHHLCDYVWQDLRDHWYPQLRLVLGDHSSTRKAHCSRHAHRRLKLKQRSESGKRDTATTDAATDATTVRSPAISGATSSSGAGTVQWRSLSSPCFFNGDVRITRDSSAHQRMSGKEGTGAAATRHFHASNSSSSSSGPSSPPPAPSTKEGMRLYVVMTAEAVASAAQGLLVFLL